LGFVEAGEDHRDGTFVLSRAEGTIQKSESLDSVAVALYWSQFSSAGWCLKRITCVDWSREEV